MAFRKAKAVYLLYAISTTVIVVMVHLSGVLNTNSTRALKTQNAHKGTLKPEQWEGAPRMPQSRMEGAAVLNASRPKVIPVNEIFFLIIRENCKDDLPKRRQKAFLLFHFFKEEPWVKFFFIPIVVTRIRKTLYFFVRLKQWRRSVRVKRNSLLR